jgi:hypothetical protein
MKKIILSAILSATALSFLQAQDDEEKGGWKNHHLFIGSGLNLGFSNGFIIGLNPEVGYSITRFLDAGIATNLTYVTQRSQVANASARYLALGAGPFLRIWPARMIFLGGQFEYNAITYREVQNGSTVYKEKANAPSLLAGLGYGNRIIGQSQFYTSIMIDLLKDGNSPYRDQFGRVLPVFRTGFLIYLGRSGRNH